MMFLNLTKNRQFPYLGFCGVSFVFTLTSLVVSIISAFVGGWIQEGPGVYIASFDKNPEYVWINTLFQIAIMITELTTLLLLALFIYTEKETLKRLSLSVAIVSLIVSLELLIFVMIWYPPQAMEHQSKYDPDHEVVLSSFYWNLFFVVICDAFAITNAILTFKEYNAFTQYIPAQAIYHTPKFDNDEKKGLYIGLRY
ncbi:unnamed protein product [Auanema sp. JU1783]|nr:unnamed protein product [Auanema sp. JU1783]